MNQLTKVAPLGARAPLSADEKPEPEREIRFLGDLQRLQPQPGDVFVLTCTQALSADQCDHLTSYWKRVMGDTKLLVLCDGLKLGCIGAGSGD